MLRSTQIVRLIITKSEGPICAEGEVRIVGHRNLYLQLKDPEQVPTVFEKGASAILQVMGDHGLETGSTTIVEFDPKADGWIMVRRPPEFTLDNRRKFFRLRASGDVKVALKPPSPAVPVPSLDPLEFEGILRDFSAGGIGFGTTEPLDVGALVTVRVALRSTWTKSKFPQDLRARVMRSEFTPGIRDWPWLVGVEFVGLPERHRAALVRLGFELERGQGKS
jgi:hypothetical protein